MSIPTLVSTAVESGILRRLAVAMGIDVSFRGKGFAGLIASPRKRIAGPRIGISRDQDFPLRFGEQGKP